MQSIADSKLYPSSRDDLVFSAVASLDESLRDVALPLALILSHKVLRQKSELAKNKPRIDPKTLSVGATNSDD
jgi:hypothetical protein